MYKRVFLDANILLDYISSDRAGFTDASELIEYSILEDIELYTSCDIVTTLYYISAKHDRVKALDNVSEINKFCKIIEFSNHEVAQTCSLMMEDSNYIDLEDTIQYILAKKYSCDLIISNDKNFVSKDIELFSAKEFVNEKIKVENI